jgi:hypothetical protein
LCRFSFRGEIKDLFERVTKDELEKSILNGDHQKQDHMRYLIQALPFHSDEIERLEEVAKKAATTKASQIEPEIPEELKTLLKSYGLLDKDGNPIELAPLPVLDDADSPSSLLSNENGEKEFSLEELQEQVKKTSLVKAKDFEAFKPIEGEKKNVSSDMESFLKQFGLFDSEEDSKKKKSVKSTKVQGSFDVPSIDSAYLIPGYSSLLDNIGITTIKDKNGKKTNTKASTNIYKPNKGEGDDYKKLEQLLETIRELEKLNASLTEKEVEKLNLQNYNFSDSILAEGPDPLEYQIHYSALKNEVKRQEPSDEPTKVALALTGTLLESSLEATDDSKDDKSSVTATTSKPSVTTTTAKASTTTEASTTEEAKKNSLEDEIEPIDDPEPLPPPRRSGFYMLFDWNSFLEVGEEPDKVVIRFDPKIGDPSRFLPVSVP